MPIKQLVLFLLCFLLPSSLLFCRREDSSKKDIVTLGKLGTVHSCCYVAPVKKRKSGVYKKERVHARSKVKQSKLNDKAKEVPHAQQPTSKEPPPSEIIKKAPPVAITFKGGDVDVVFSGKYVPELFYGYNLALLNDNNKVDRILPIRHTLDLSTNVVFGRRTYGYDAAKLDFTLRNKGVWGNPATIVPTTEGRIKSVDATIGSHRHSLARHVMWIRKLSLQTSLNAVFDSHVEKQHYVKIGYHPFLLGNGIALGPAFALNPGFLGFYNDFVVDQFAPGILFSGEAIKDKLSYDVYGSLLENKSDSVSNTSEEIYKKAFGLQGNPARGFGSINWLVAGRVQATAIPSNDAGVFKFEPYILYNRAPEQKIEFQGGAEGKLGTVGLYFTHNYKDYEFTFEVAKNFGNQKILGWDRDTIIKRVNPTTGAVEHVHSHIFDANGDFALDTTASATAASSQVICSATDLSSYNGQTIPGTTLVNADDRFRACFENRFKGWILVSDIGCWLFDKQLQVALAFGIASGDDDPLLSIFEDTDTSSVRDFTGFIGLQEVYNGNKVESSYVLGQRRLSRPLTLPNAAHKRGHYASTVSSFSNIIYVGSSLQVKPAAFTSNFCWRPNILAYWQESATRAFDLATRTTSTTKNARSFLGIEINSFVDLDLLECLKLSFVGSVFFPGSHYDDVRGTPLSSTHLRLLDRDDVDLTSLPLLGTNNAVLFNVRLEYSF